MMQRWTAGRLIATDSSSKSEFSDNEINPVSYANLGHPTSRHTTLCGLKDTHTQVYDPVNISGNFNAEWFHGVISRKDSERLLKNKPVGCFLIRVSESRFGYTLSFRAKERARHYMINQLPNKKFNIIGEQKIHKTLKDLVEYHTKNKLSNWDGLLKDPCVQEYWERDYMYQEVKEEDFYATLEKEEDERGIRNSKAPQELKRVSQQRPISPLNNIYPCHFHGTPPSYDRTYTQNMENPAHIRGRPLPKTPCVRNS